MSGEQKSGESKVQIPQFRQASAKALAEGKTTGYISSSVRPPSPGRRRARWHRYLMSGKAKKMNKKRNIGHLDEIEKHGEKRKAVTPIIKAIGRRNRDAIPIRARMGVKEGKEAETIPSFLTERIKELSKDPISDLTKTSLGAESQRKATGIKEDKRRKKIHNLLVKEKHEKKKTKREENLKRGEEKQRRENPKREEDN